jgi:hypothetical protein
MKSDTVVNQVRRAAQHFHHIDAALFTAFSFSPDFFEDSVLPVILRAEEGNRSARAFMVHQRLAEIPVSVYYDPTARKGAGGIYRYSAQAVPVPGRFFHPKNIMLAGRDAHGNPLVYLSVSSANLTLSGWGRNSEVFAATWIHTRKQQAWGALKGFLSWLEAKSGVEVENAGFDALSQVAQTLDLMRDRRRFADSPGKPWTGTQYDRIYFSPGQKKGLSGFVWRRRRPLKMTVLAPYWNSVASELRRFNPIEAELIPTLLPRTPACTGLQKDEKVQATEMFANTTKELVVAKLADDAGERFWHAKAYHLAYEKSADLAVGSCNFTQAGLAGSKGNVESMLVRHVGKGPAPFPKRVDADAALLADETEHEEGIPTPAPINIVVLFDWRAMAYAWRYEPHSGHSNPVLELPGGVKVPLTACPGMRKAKKGPAGIATFEVHYTADSNQQSWVGLVAEINLDASERIYGTPLRVSDILDSWKGAHLAGVASWSRLVAGASEEEGDEADATDVGVFHALNLFEVYRAFWDLRGRLQTLKEQKNEQAVRGLLVSRPDSVLALMRLAIRADGAETVRYLVMLEIRVLLREFGDESMKIHQKRLDGNVRRLRKVVEGSIVLHGATGVELLKWFESRIERAGRPM